MEFGLFSNGERTNSVAADSYDEDLFEVITADKLGMKEAWISEHVSRTKGSRPDTMPVADMFIVKAAAMTKKIMLGPGVRPIAIYHPVQVATDAAVADQLTRGRYMFGFGVGGPGGDQMQQRGLGENSTNLRRERMHEAIDLITRCWEATEPFDYEGAFWQGKGINASPHPYQKPRMPVGVASSKTMGTAQMAGEKGFYPLFSQYDEPHHMSEMAEAYLEGCDKAGRPQIRRNIRACRFIYVSDTQKKAREELRPTITPSIERHKRGFPHHFAHCLPPSGDVMDITWDYLVDGGHWFVGGPDEVYDLCKHHYDESGGFGTLCLVVGKDWGTRQQRARSMKLFMEKVAPRLRELDPDRKGELEAVY